MYVRNVLICREAPVTYREDMALESAWHEEVGTVGLNHTMVSRLNKVSTKSGLNTICRLNPLVIFPEKVRNSFNTGVLLYGRKVHAAYKIVEEYLCIFNSS